MAPIKKVLGDTFKTIQIIGEGLAAQKAAEEEAYRLCGQSGAVARRQIRVLARNAEEGAYGSYPISFLIDELDKISRNSSGERADFAAELAEFAEGFR